MHALQDVGRNQEIDALEERSRRSRARLLWLLWFIFCTVMLLSAVHEYLADGGTQLWEPLLWDGSSLLVATGILILQQTARRRYSAYLEKPLQWFGHHAKWLPLVCVIFVPTVYGIRHGVYSLAGQTYQHGDWLYVFTYESIRLVIFLCLWLGVLFSVESHAHWQGQQQRLLLLQRSLSEAKLSQLRSQLHPHFFFNVLNTISALMHLDVARADRLLSRLGELLRSSLQASNKELVPLREELRLLELYAHVMLERYADRVTLEWCIDDDTADVPVLTLLLQPLLENAFRHGIERTRGNVHVKISARRESDRLVLSVTNCGTTLPAQIEEGVGLRNCRERLRVAYGDEAMLTLTFGEQSVEARISIPARSATS